MNLQQYQIDASRTESSDGIKKIHPVLLDNALLAYIQLGQILDQVKKNVFYNKPYDQSAIQKNVNICRSALDLIEIPVDTSGPHDLLSVCTSNERIFHSIVGIATESTELVEALADNVSYGKDFDYVNISEEMGDIHWYQSIAFSEMQVDWDGAFETNIAKLKARYPNKFTDEDAQVRNLEKERNILEEGAAK